MATSTTCTVIVDMTPKPGAAEKLLEIRPRMTAEFERDKPGFISATLYRVDDSDQWRDVVVFSDRASAESSTTGPAYLEWSELVDVAGWEMLETLAEHVV